MLTLLLMTTTPTLANLPPSVDLRPRFDALGLAPKSQVPRGCCSLFAMNSVLEFEFAQSTGKTVRLSEEYLNWASHQSNGRTSDGSFFADALRGIRMFGVCEESLMPYAQAFDPNATPSPQAIADAEARQDASAVWVKPWDVHTGMTDEMLGQIRQSLVDGHPLAIGLRWPNEERYEPGLVLALPPEGKVFDGHSLTLVGYRDDPALPGGGAFLYRNSFGPTWGEGGYAWMPYAYAQAYGNDALGLRTGGGSPLPNNRAAWSPIEAESLPIADKHDCDTSVQQMTPWGAAVWSGGAQLFCGCREGGSLTLLLPVKRAGRYSLDLYATRAPDFGLLRLSLDGRRLGPDFDAYAAEVQPSGRLSLGTLHLPAGDHRLRLEVVDKNGESTGYSFGLDCLDLQPQAGHS